MGESRGIKCKHIFCRKVSLLENDVMFEFKQTLLWLGLGQWRRIHNKPHVTYYTCYGGGFITNHMSLTTLTTLKLNINDIYKIELTTLNSVCDALILLSCYIEQHALSNILYYVFIMYMYILLHSTCTCT